VWCSICGGIYNRPVSCTPAVATALTFVSSRTNCSAGEAEVIAIDSLFIINKRQHGSGCKSVSLQNNGIDLFPKPQFPLISLEYFPLPNNGWGSTYLGY